MNKNCKDILNNIIQAIRDLYDPNEAKNIAFLILQECLSVSKTDILLDNPVKIIPNQLQSIITELQNGTPVQYIIGHVWFLDSQLVLSKDVLIPRPETEELATLIIDECNDIHTALDIGTGSGCIALSIAKYVEKCEVTGIDISEDAISIAQKNNVILDNKCSFKVCDIFNCTATELGYKKYDLIVSNPPYIPNKEKLLMNKRVYMNEPNIALFVPNENPLIFYKKIASVGLKSLTPNGKIYLEVHENLANEVGIVLENHGYQQIKIRKDLQKKNRFVSAFLVK